MSQRVTKKPNRQTKRGQPGPARTPKPPLQKREAVSNLEKLPGFKHVRQPKANISPALPEPEMPVIRLGGLPRFPPSSKTDRTATREQGLESLEQSTSLDDSCEAVSPQFRNLLDTAQKRNPPGRNNGTLIRTAHPELLAWLRDGAIDDEDCVALIELLGKVPRPANALEKLEGFWREARAGGDLFCTAEDALFVCARMLGKSVGEANYCSRCGPKYLILERRNELFLVQNALKHHGISQSPISFPRKIVQVKSMETLGKGSFNKVYKITWQGKEWAWKPARKDTQPSFQATMRGIHPDAHFPVESNLLGAWVDNSLAQESGDPASRSIGQTMVALVNGKPGLLMEIAQGSDERLGAHAVRRKVYEDDLLTQKLEALSQTLPRFKDQLRDPCVQEAVCKLLGLTALSFDEQDELIYSGTFVDAVQAPIDASLFSDPEFLKHASDALIGLDISGASDLHTGNCKVGPDGHTVSFYDLDDAGAAVEVKQALERSADVQHHRLFMPPVTLYCSKARCAALLSDGFARRMQRLQKDLAGHYPQNRLKALVQRYQDRKQRAQDGRITAVNDGQDWLKIDFSNPFTTWLGRIKAPITGKGYFTSSVREQAHHD